MLVLCSGMKRSGSTWQFNVVCQILGMKRRVAVEGFLADDELIVRRGELVEWANDAEVYHVVKTHAILNASQYGLDSTGVRITYTYRDIRDVAVSMKRQFCAEGRRLMSLLEEAVEAFHKVRNMSETICQQYEYFTTQEHGAIRELAEFFGIEIDDEEVGEIIRACSIETMKKVSDQQSASWKKRLFKRFWHFNRQLPLKPLLLKLGFPLSLWIKIRNICQPYDGQTLLRPDHVSSDGGASGTWRQHLSGAEISLIEDRFGAWLMANGYLSSSDIEDSIDQ